MGHKINMQVAKTERREKRKKNMLKMASYACERQADLEAILDITFYTTVQRWNLNYY